MVGWCGRLHNGLALQVVGDALSIFVLQAACMPPNVHREVTIASDHHLVKGFVPLVGEDDLVEDVGLDLSIEEVEGVLLINVLLSQFEGELHQVLGRMANLGDSVLDKSTCGTAIKVNFSLYIDVVGTWLLLDLVDFFLHLYQEGDKGTELALLLAHKDVFFEFKNLLAQLAEVLELLCVGNHLLSFGQELLELCDSDLRVYHQLMRLHELKLLIVILQGGIS